MSFMVASTLPISCAFHLFLKSQKTPSVWASLLSISHTAGLMEINSLSWPSSENCLWLFFNLKGYFYWALNSELTCVGCFFLHQFKTSPRLSMASGDKCADGAHPLCESCAFSPNTKVFFFSLNGSSLSMMLPFLLLWFDTTWSSEIPESVSYVFYQIWKGSDHHLLKYFCFVLTLLLFQDSSCSVTFPSKNCYYTVLSPKRPSVFFPPIFQFGIFYCSVFKFTALLSVISTLQVSSSGKSISTGILFVSSTFLIWPFP